MQLPDAAMYKKNDDGDLVKIAASEQGYTIEVMDPTGASVNVDNDRQFLFDKDGLYVVRYICNYKSGQKFFNQDFEVTVQKSVKDTVQPIIEMPTNIPRNSISLNTKITLPKAKATDSYDKNVKIIVTVTVDGDPVKVATVDKETGYATGIAIDAKDVVFDNNKNMSFYPTDEGKYYVIKYIAVDDSGRFSKEYSYNPPCIDDIGPKLISIDDFQIPTTWGLNTVSKAKIENGEIVVGEKTPADTTAITFPFPVYKDNSSAADAFKISFEITDSHNNKQVLKFENINATTGGGNEATSSVYADSAKQTFDKDTPFEFDFAKYKPEKGETIGSYTVTYKATDSKTKSTYKSYTINLESDYEDLNLPNVSVTFDKYIGVWNTEKEYTVPTATITDSKDSRLDTSYTISNGTDSLVVKSDDILLVNGDNGKTNANTIAFKDVSSKKDTDTKSIGIPTTVDNLTFKIESTDDVGNVIVKEEDIALIRDDLSFTAPTIITDGSNVLVGALNVTSFDKATNNGVATFGDVAFTTATGTKDFSGFELTLLNESGNIINSLSFETFRSGDIIVARDLKFKPSKVGTYKLVIRSFTIFGKSSVVVAEKEITNSGGETDPGVPNSIDISPTGNAFETYKLKNSDGLKSVRPATGKEFIVRQISGAGKVSLVGGVDFATYTSGTIHFTDGYYPKSVTENNTVGTYHTFEAVQLYSMAATNQAKPEISIQGIIPSYSPKDKEVILPFVVGYTDYNDAKITVEVKTPTTTLSIANGKIKIRDGVGYVFNAIEDGKYTITYTANQGSSNSNVLSATMLCGDITQLPFSVATDTNINKYVVNKTTTKFVFQKLVLDDTTISDTELEKYTVTKELLNSKLEPVYSISGSAKDYKDKTTKDDDEGYVFESAETYTVKYTTTKTTSGVSFFDDATTITVTGTSTASSAPWRVISTILIIVGALLIVGVVIYFARYRKVKVK